MIGKVALGQISFVAVLAVFSALLILVSNNDFAVSGVSVQLPSDGEHLVLRPYREILERLIRSFSGNNDRVSRALAANLQFKLKWAGPRQLQGVLNKNDLIEVAGEDAFQRVLEGASS